MRIDSDMSFSFDESNGSTTKVGSSWLVCDFPEKIHPTQLTTQFIQHITKYMQKISKNKISSPRWVSHPTLSNLHKEQI